MDSIMFTDKNFMKLIVALWLAVFLYMLYTVGEIVYYTHMIHKYLAS